MVSGKFKHMKVMFNLSNAIFQELCTIIAQVILAITSYTKTNKMQLDKSNTKAVVLYLSQIITLLSFLIQIFLKEDEVKETIVVSILVSHRKSV